MEQIYLQGSEDVRRAASRMSEAASEMQQAARNMEGVFEQHHRFMDDWLLRLECLLERKTTS